MSKQEEVMNTSSLSLMIIQDMGMVTLCKENMKLLVSLRNLKHKLKSN